DCLNAMQKKWHPTCFTCAHCHKPFGNTAFYLENGLAYCETVYGAFITKPWKDTKREQTPSTSKQFFQGCFNGECDAGVIRCGATLTNPRQFTDG
ncbi:LIM domain protein, partial [Teladorsagia circumcincta]